MLEVPWYVYIIESEDRSFYTGISENPHIRFEHHHLKKGAFHTRQNKVTSLRWIERHESLTSARKREKQIKCWTRRKKIALIENNLSLLKLL